MAGEAVALGEEPFMVVAFTAPQAERQVFDAWPQHMTIAPWLQGHRLQATNRIVDAANQYGFIEVNIEAEEQFGNGDIAVWTLADNAAVQGLHQAVLQAAVKSGTELQEDIGDVFKPHITKKAAQPQYTIGDTLQLTEISIIGKVGRAKTLFRNIPLCGKGSTKRS